VFSRLMTTRPVEAKMLMPRPARPDFRDRDRDFSSGACGLEPARSKNRASRVWKRVYRLGRAAYRGSRGAGVELRGSSGCRALSPSRYTRRRSGQH